MKKNHAITHTSETCSKTCKPRGKTNFIPSQKIEPQKQKTCKKHLEKGKGERRSLFFTTKSKACLGRILPTTMGECGLAYPSLYKFPTGAIAANIQRHIRIARNLTSQSQGVSYLAKKNNNEFELFEIFRLDPERKEYRLWPHERLGS